MAEIYGYTGLDATHIADQLSNYEAARSSFFTFIIEPNQGENSDFGFFKTSISDPSKSTSDSDKIMKVQEIIRLNVTKASVPHFSIDVLEYTRGNEKIKFAGKPSFDAGSITVDDIIGLDTKSVLMAWQGAAYNINTRKTGRMVDYKRNCRLVEYSADFVEIRSWKLYGCWIDKIDEGEFDRESGSDKRQLTASIQYDRAEMIVPVIEK